MKPRPDSVRPRPRPTMPKHEAETETTMSNVSCNIKHTIISLSLSRHKTDISQTSVRPIAPTNCS